MMWTFHLVKQDGFPEIHSRIHQRSFEEVWVMGALSASRPPTADMVPLVNSLGVEIFSNYYQKK